MVNFEILEYTATRINELREKEQCIRNIEMSMVTNGLLLNEEKVRRLHELSINEKILSGKARRQELQQLPEYSEEHYQEEVQRTVDRLHILVKILHTPSCLMQQLVSYLGENHPKTCGHCSHCQRNRKGGAVS